MPPSLRTILHAMDATGSERTTLTRADVVALIAERDEMEARLRIAASGLRQWTAERLAAAGGVGEPSATCPRCNCEVDPTTCQCGDAIDGSAHDNHYAVPQGCRCHERPILIAGVDADPIAGGGR